MAIDKKYICALFNHTHKSMCSLHGIAFCNAFVMYATHVFQACPIELVANLYHIRTHGHVSVAKKSVWHTSVLFTGTTNSPFSTPGISITTEPISMTFMYFMPSIYATLHTKLKRNRLSSSRDMCSLKLPHFLHILLFFFFLACFTKVTLNQPKTSNLAHL